MIQNDIKNQSVPTLLNIAVFIVVVPVTWLLLWIASNTNIYTALLAAWIFSLVNNTAFSLLHEAVHGCFSRNKFYNELFGVQCAATFPTSFTLQRIAHLGHHRRNRTDEELYDYYLPTQSKLLRDFWLYAGNLLGFYWFCIPFSNLIYLVAPKLYTSKWFINGLANFLGFGPYVREIAEQSNLRIWLECAYAFSYQLLLWWLLDLNITGWLLCYWAFALHWSALQYVDHAWSPRDVINGAWNLKVLAVSRFLALNYHYHLAHHRNPHISWVHLPKLLDKGELQPTFWSIYFSLWGGTRPAPPMEPIT